MMKIWSVCFALGCLLVLECKGVMDSRMGLVGVYQNSKMQVDGNFVRALIVDAIFEKPISVGLENQPFEQSNAYGLVRMTCGKYLYESVPGHKSDKHSHGSLQTYPFLFPLHSSPHKPFHAALSQIYNIQDPLTLRFAMIVNNSMHYDILKNTRCSLKILPPEKQVNKPARILHFNNDSHPIYDTSLITKGSIKPIISSTLNPSNIATQIYTPEFEESSRCVEEEMTVSVATLMGNAIAGALSPITAPIGGAIGGPISAAASEMAGANVLSGIADILTLDVTTALAPQISQVLIPSLTLTMTDSLTNSLSDSLTEYLTSSLCPLIEKELTEKLDSELGEAIPDIVGADVPSKIAIDLVENVAPLLTRSLASSISAAVLHTNTHSPLSDYYCYYCYYHEVYCDYCHYSPSQAYYAAYYTDYYSSYYSKYYTEYFGNSLKQQLQNEEELAKEYEKTREMYDIVAET